VGLRGVALGSAPLRGFVIQENNFQNEICPKADSDRSAIFKIIAAFYLLSEGGLIIHPRRQFQPRIC